MFLFWCDFNHLDFICSVLAWTHLISGIQFQRLGGHDFASHRGTSEIEAKGFADQLLCKYKIYGGKWSHKAVVIQFHNDASH